MRVQIAGLPHTVIQQIKSILIGWEETNDLFHSFIKLLGEKLQSYLMITESISTQFIISQFRVSQKHLFRICVISFQENVKIGSFIVQNKNSESVDLYVKSHWF